MTVASDRGSGVRPLFDRDDGPVQSTEVYDPTLRTPEIRRDPTVVSSSVDEGSCPDAPITDVLTAMLYPLATSTLLGVDAVDRVVDAVRSGERWRVGPLTRLDVEGMVWLAEIGERQFVAWPVGGTHAQLRLSCD